MRDAVVVTGLGVVSPLSCEVEPLWQALRSGTSALHQVTGFDPGPGAPRLAAQVREIPAREALPAAQVRRMDRLSRMICVAGVRAATQAGLAGVAREGHAIVVGSGLGNMTESAQFLERAFQRPALANPMLFPNLVLNAPASQLAIALGWRGPNLAVSEGEISGEVAVEAALDLLRRERTRAVIAAAGDEVAPVVFRALRDLGMLSPRDGEREWSSPFDRGANGPVLGEGAAAVVLERREDAERRGAAALAVLEGVDRFAIPGSAPHLWAQRSTALDPGAEPPDVVLSGADSSPQRDRLELELLAGLGERPVGAWKGMLGDFPAAGLTGLVLAVVTLARGELVPLATLERPRETRLVLSREPQRGAWRRGWLLGVARGGAGARIRLARA